MNPKTGEITSEKPSPNKIHEFITKQEETKISNEEIPKPAAKIITPSKTT